MAAPSPWRPLGEYDAALVAPVQRWWRRWARARAVRALASAYRASEASRAPRMRLGVLQEIVATEELYVQQLSAVAAAYIRPLRDALVAERAVVSSAELARLFLNVETLHTLNQSLLTRLRVRESKFPLHYTFGDVFVELIPAMKLYIDYVNGFSGALATYKGLCEGSKDFADFLARAREAASAKGVEQDLPSLLITPVQRIPRYELLLREALKHTDERNPDHALLNKALRDIQELNQTINAKRKEHERSVRVFEIEKRLVCAEVTPDLFATYVSDAPAHYTEVNAQLKRKTGHAYLLKDCLLLTRTDTAFATTTKGSMPSRKRDEKPANMLVRHVKSISMTASDMRRRLSISLLEGPKKLVRIPLDALAIEKTEKAEAVLVRSGGSAWEVAFEEHRFPEFYLQLTRAVVERRAELGLPTVSFPDVTALEEPASKAPLVALIKTRSTASKQRALMKKEVGSPDLLSAREREMLGEVEEMRNELTSLALELQHKDKAVENAQSEKRKLQSEIESLRELFSLASKRLAVLESNRPESEKVAKLLSDNEKLQTTISLLTSRIENFEAENKELRLALYRAQNAAQSPRGEVVVAGPPKILSPRKGFGTPEDSSYDLAELLKARAGSKLIRTARLDQIFGRKLAKRREVSCFLFDDLLLVAELFELLSKEKDVSHGKSRYTTLAAVPLKHMSVTDLSGLEGVEHGVQVEDITEGECLILDMGTVGVKLEWLKALRDNIKEFQRQRMAQMVFDMQVRERAREADKDAPPDEVDAGTDIEERNGDVHATSANSERKNKKDDGRGRLQGIVKALSFRNRKSHVDSTPRQGEVPVSPRGSKGDTAGEGKNDSERTPEKESIYEFLREVEPPMSTSMPTPEAPSESTEGKKKRAPRRSVILFANKKSREALGSAMSTDKEAEKRVTISEGVHETPYEFLSNVEPPAAVANRSPPTSPRLRARADEEAEGEAGVDEASVVLEPLPPRLARIVGDAALTAQWLSYLEQCYALDNWQFYEAVLEYKRTKSRARRRQLQYGIIERFLTPGATDEMQLGPSVVQPILDDFVRSGHACSGDVHVFDRCLALVGSFLEDESAVRFLRIPAVAALVHGSATAPPGVVAFAPPADARASDDRPYTEQASDAEADSMSRSAGRKAGSRGNLPRVTSGGGMVTLQKSSNATLQALAKSLEQKRAARTATAAAAPVGGPSVILLDVVTRREVSYTLPSDVDDSRGFAALMAFVQETFGYTGGVALRLGHLALSARHVGFLQDGDVLEVHVN